MREQTCLSTVKVFTRQYQLLSTHGLEMVADMKAVFSSLKPKGLVPALAES